MSKPVEIEYRYICEQNGLWDSAWWRTETTVNGEYRSDLYSESKIENFAQELREKMESVTIKKIK